VVSAFSVDVIDVLLGRGDGSFGSAKASPSGVGPTRIAVGDFNEDGNLDLSVVGLQFYPFETAVLLLLGRGDGTFGIPTQLLEEFWIASIVAGDFNGDGILDLCMSNRLGYASLILGNGDGNFGAATSYETGYDSFDLVVGDFDSDRRLDIAVANQGSSDVTVLINHGPFPNRPPSADAAAVSSAECQSSIGADVTLDGSASTDPDSSTGTNDDIVLFEWFEGFQTSDQVLLATGEKPTVRLSLGVHHVTLRVTDFVGATDTDDVVITVVDSTPPAVVASVSPSILWPPNQKLSDVRTIVSANDMCGRSSVILSSILIDDSVGPTGPDDATEDIKEAEYGTFDTAFQLRAVANPSGSGRRYVITYRAVDESGNASTTTLEVLVPRNLGRLPSASSSRRTAGQSKVLGDRLQRALDPEKLQLARQR
jgi:hypothetical protein